MPPHDNTIKYLINLLDDEDDSVAFYAMAQLLGYEKEIRKTLATLQESESPLMRRRTHQLQNAITLRQRRREFIQKIRAREVDVIDALIDLHLLWYDSDSSSELNEKFQQFWEDATCSTRSPSLDEIQCVMSLSEIAPAYETTTHPEFYCIGSVLSNRIGAPSILVAIAYALTEADSGIQIARFQGKFALIDKNRRLLFPGRDWYFYKRYRHKDFEIWTPRKMIYYIAQNLFTGAVNTDSFRYVLTIAEAITGSPTDDYLQHFPYPYNSAPGSADLKNFFKSFLK